MQLFINRPGTSIRRKNNRFDISHAEGTHRISPLQVQSILISAGIKISSDAILLAVEHDIDLLFVDQAGQPQARIWSHRFGSISTIRKHQVYFATGPAGLAWTVDILTARIQGMMQVLDGLKLPKETQKENRTFFTSIIQTFDQHRQHTLSDHLKAQMRGWEGNATRRYFKLLSAHLPLAFQFRKRSRRPALDPFNAALNYLYGILYAKIEIALIKAGIDPYLGVFHRDEYNRPVLVYDMIEAYRHWAEQVLIELCTQDQLSQQMFRPHEEGIWLNEDGKAVIVPSFQLYLEGKIDLHGTSRSRLQHIQQTCHALAKQMLAYDLTNPF